MEQLLQYLKCRYQKSLKKPIKRLLHSMNTMIEVATLPFNIIKFWSGINVNNSGNMFELFKELSKYEEKSEDIKSDKFYKFSELLPPRIVLFKAMLSVNYSFMYSGRPYVQTYPRDIGECLTPDEFKKFYHLMVQMYRETHEEAKYNLYSNKFDVKACAEKIVGFLKEHESKFIDNLDNFKWKLGRYVKGPKTEPEVKPYSFSLLLQKEKHEKHEDVEPPKKHCRLVELFYW